MYGSPFGFGPAFGAGLVGAFALVAIVVAVWSMFWMGLSLWHAARNKQWGWFIALLIVHTVGILDLVYLFAFRNDRESTHVFPWTKKASSTPKSEKKEDTTLPVAESSPAE